MRLLLLLRLGDGCVLFERLLGHDDMRNVSVKVV